MTRKLRGKSIVITGASSGIGAAVARACAAQGMTVVLTARREDRLKQVAAEMEHNDVTPAVIACDVNNPVQIDDMMARAREAVGRIDVVFANAGYGFAGGVVETPDQAIRDIFETNFMGTVWTLRSAARVMREQGGGGHLLICSSAASEISIPRFGYYAATKAAQDSIAGALRAELKAERIHVTSIHPIGTRTGFFDTAQARSQAPGVKLNTPDALMQSADHVARKIVAALRRPRAEVWPAPAVRYALALTTAFPGLGAWALGRMLDRQTRDAQAQAAAQADEQRSA